MQFRRAARGFFWPAVVDAALARHPHFLHHQLCFTIRNAKAAQGVIHKPEGQFALAHDGYAHVLLHQLGDIGRGVGTHCGVDVRIQVAHQLAQ